VDDLGGDLARRVLGDPVRGVDADGRRVRCTWDITGPALVFLALLIRMLCGIRNNHAARLVPPHYE
jgi:hypothetical protein